MMDRPSQDTLLSLDSAELPRRVLWDIARDPYGKVRFTAYPAAQRAGANINARQTIHILSCVAELAAIIGFAFMLRAYGPQENVPDQITVRIMGVIGLTVAIRHAFAVADPHPLATKHCSPALAALSLAAAFLALVFIQFLLDRQYLVWTLAWALLSVASALLIRAAIWRSGWALDSGGVALLGEAGPVQDLSASLSRPGRHPVVARLDHDTPSSISTLRAMVEDGHVETVVLTAIPPQTLNSTLNRLADLPIAVYLSPNLGPTQAPVHEVVEVLPNLLTGPAGLAKRVLDLAGSLAGLALLGPLLLLSALLIRLETPGPILFRQVRFGLGGRAMEVWKFRTMYCDKGDPTGESRTLPQDPRVTRVGRFLRRLSIDELPQIINVLRGEMSLVGPRPHATRMKVANHFYADAVRDYAVRHRVKPGITGWAQINGSRGEVDTMEKAARRVELDLWYITNWNLFLDIWIITRTAAGGFATLKAD